MAHNKYVSPRRSAKQTAMGYRNKKYTPLKKLIKGTGPVFKNI